MTEPPTPNIGLLREVLVHIDAHPKSWGQGFFVAEDPQCGTTHCVAGWALLLSGCYYTDGQEFFPLGRRSAVEASTVAQRLLGITTDQALNTEDGWGLFYDEANRDDIQRIAEKLAAEAGCSYEQREPRDHETRERLTPAAGQGWLL
jgi:hypothetical protein